MYGVWSGSTRPKGRPRRTWKEVVQKDCQARKLNTEDAVDPSRWRKLIRDDWWSGEMWVGECFFWYRLTRVVPDKGLYNGCSSCLFYTFCALMLLVGWQEGHPPCKKLSGGMLAWLFSLGEVQIFIWPSWCHCRPTNSVKALKAVVNMILTYFTYVHAPAACWWIHVADFSLVSQRLRRTECCLLDDYAGCGLLLDMS